MKRFWDEVNIRSNCWEWQGARRPDGYGVFKIDKKTVQAHRQAFELTNGKIPKGKLILHRCDNRPCCNPNHLFMGTYADNTTDMVQKKRHPHKETNGRSKLTLDDVMAAQKLYAMGDITLATLAQKYGITRQAMGNAVKGRSW